jgi:hypothetical protein
MAMVRRWGILLGAWAGVALFASGAIWLSWLARGLPGDVPLLLLLEGPVWFYWVAASVSAVLLSRRYPLDRSRPWTSVGFHLVSAIIIATLFVGFRMLWYQAYNPQPYTDPHVAMWFWRMFREHFVGGFTLYWAIVGVYHAFTNYSRLQQRELEATIVRGQLAEARLEALQLQLRPHFLFNALNTASAVLEEHPRRARRIIGRLGEVLRATLRTNARHLVSLGEELELVAAYLEIEEERFGGRLVSEFDVSPDVANAAVPNFLLQPLVENAIRHGIARRPGPGRVAVRVRQLGGQLVIHVEDDGVGLQHGPIREGIGLGNTRRRLRELYQAHQAVTLQGHPSGGLDVCVRFPFALLQPEPREGAA